MCVNGGGFGHGFDGLRCLVPLLVVREIRRHTTKVPYLNPWVAPGHGADPCSVPHAAVANDPAQPWTHRLASLSDVEVCEGSWETHGSFVCVDNNARTTCWNFLILASIFFTLWSFSSTLSVRMTHCFWTFSRSDV